MTPLESEPVYNMHGVRAGELVYCMPCMSRLVVVGSDAGQFDAQVAY